MKRRIIVEGADQQGKSQLCELLLELLSDEWSLKHYSMPQEDFNFTSDYITEEKVISDRSFYSEVIYSMVLGRKCRIPGYSMRQLFAYAESKTVVFYVFREDEDFVFDKSRHEEYDLDTINRVRNAYETFMSVNMNNIVMINMTHVQDLRKYLKYIVDTRIDDRKLI